jgi:hypothetical protein
MTYKRPFKAINTNTAIMDTFTLAQGWQNVLYRQTTLERPARRDEAARFGTREFLEGFRLMNKQSSSMMRFRQAKLTILICGSKGGEIRQNGNLVQILARKCNPIKEPSQRGFDGGYEITSRCIEFESPVASRYAQSNSITSEQKKSDNEIHLVLTTCSSQKIEIRCCSF